MANAVGGAVRRYRYLIVGAWLLAAGVLNLVVPQLDTVVFAHSPRFVPADAPSAQALTEMGKRFGESTGSGIVYLVLHRDTGLTAADRAFYDAVVRAARADPARVESVMDLWSSPATAPAVRSTDGQAAYLLLRTAGDTGTTAASESVAAVRASVASVPKPDGLSVDVTGPTVSVADLLDGAHRDLLIITAITVVLIALLLMLVYRSIFAAAIPLATIGLCLAIARPVVAFAGEHGVETSIFSVAMLSAMILGAGTDYAIFALSRYHEARRAGRGQAEAYDVAYRRISPVLIASGLAVSVTCTVMSAARIGMFRTIGIPCAIGILVVVCASVTLTPALIAIAGQRGLIEPKGTGSARYWRGLASVVVRRPARMLAVSLVPVLALIAVLSTLALNYDERATQPADTSANHGFAVTAAHYPGNQLLPNYLLIRSDTDLRSPGVYAALDSIAAAVAAMPGIVAVNGLTRPFGGPIPQGTVGNQLGQVTGQLGAASTQLVAARPDVDRLVAATAALAGGATTADAAATRLADGTRRLDDGLTAMLDGAAQLDAGATRLRSGSAALAAGIDTAMAPIQAPLSALTALRDQIAANPHCDADPLCATARTALAALDGSAAGRVLADLGTLRDGAHTLADGNDQLAAAATRLHDGLVTARAGSTQLLAGQTRLTTGLGTLADGATQVNAGVAQVGSSFTRLATGLDQATAYLDGLRTDAGAALNNSFYLPAFALADPDIAATWAINLRYFVSPDGHLARIVVTDSGNALTTDGMARTEQILDTARRAAATTTLATSRIDVTGLTATYIDLRQLALRDLAVIILATSLLILLVLGVMLRSLVVPLYILVSVLLSYAAALGLSVLVWQHVLGRPLHWSVPSIAFIALVAVGADYNLLLMSRVRDELRAAPGTAAAIARALTSTGGVITTAGAVFAITMFAMLSSSINVVAQIGCTIGVGLLIDTLIVRTVMIPATAMLLGRHNWWPGRAAETAPRHAPEPAEEPTSGRAP
ncbi:RND family transporter [Nocardia sp. NPDC052566]|uniref:RND family transporter n=1 Tax=Nocardia sp. NPDC052566 TaxID=3364330 RepID=UPI0037C963C4